MFFWRRLDAGTNGLKILSMPYTQLQETLDFDYDRLQRIVILKKLGVICETSPRHSLLHDAITMPSMRLSELLTDVSSCQLNQRYRLLRESIVKNLSLLLDYKHDPSGKHIEISEFADQHWSQDFRPTDQARQNGILELWREALLRSGYDADTIMGRSVLLDSMDNADDMTIEEADTATKGNKRTKLKSLNPGSYRVMKMGIDTIIFILGLLVEIFEDILFFGKRSVTVLVLSLSIALLLHAQGENFGL